MGMIPIRTALNHIRPAIPYPRVRFTVPCRHGDKLVSTQTPARFNSAISETGNMIVGKSPSAITSTSVPIFSITNDYSSPESLPYQQLSFSHVAQSSQRFPVSQLA